MGKAKEAPRPVRERYRSPLKTDGPKNMHRRWVRKDRTGMYVADGYKYCNPKETNAPGSITSEADNKIYYKELVLMEIPKEEHDLRVKEREAQNEETMQAIDATDEREKIIDMQKRKRK